MKRLKTAKYNSQISLKEGNALSDFDFLIAASIVTRVISIIDKNTLCVDLGHKTIAAKTLYPVF